MRWGQFHKLVTGLSGIQYPDFVNLALGTKKDLEAIQIALSSEWSTGQTEGQVTRLKLLKRQMHGHANFDLLAAR